MEEGHHNGKQPASSDELQRPTAAERSEDRVHGDCWHDHCLVYKKLVMLQTKVAKTQPGNLVVSKIEIQKLLRKLIEWSEAQCCCLHDEDDCSRDHRRVNKRLVKIQGKLPKTKADKLLVTKTKIEKMLGNLIKWSARCCFDDCRLVYEKKKLLLKAAETKWSITFDQSDCRENMVDLSGRNPVLVEPTINNYRVSRVLMDGGAQSNLLTAKTLDTIQVPRSTIKPVYKSLGGLVPRSWTKSIGQVTLPVMFGTPENFRTEKVVFDVVDHDIPYKATAILGRQAFAKFMAITHYAYQCMKMPGPNGVITVLSSASRLAEVEDFDEEDEAC